MGPDIRPGLTYKETLKRVARDLVQWPVSLFEISLLGNALANIWEELKDVLFFGTAWIARVLMLLTLPISAPLLALFVWKVKGGRR